jgi:hypothetical protein
VSTQTGARDLALPILKLGSKRWWVVSAMTRPSYSLEKDPLPIVQDAGWASGPVWMGKMLEHTFNQPCGDDSVKSVQLQTLIRLVTVMKPVTVGYDMKFPSVLLNYY